MSQVTICLFCHETEIPMERWNRRCDPCKEKQRAIDVAEQALLNRDLQLGITTRKPAAVIQPTENEVPKGDKVFVDKFGKEVDNPGYDLVNDPRGWKFTGAEKTGGAMII